MTPSMTEYEKNDMKCVYMVKRLIRHGRHGKYSTAVLLSGAGSILLVGIAGWVYFFNGRCSFPQSSPAAVPEETVVTAPSILKIGFVTDWEYGYRKRMKHKLTLQSLPALEAAVTYLNDEYHPDIVIGGGDYIESTLVKPERAKEQLAQVNAVFRKLSAPRLYALGNHDMRSLSKADVREVLGLEENHTFRDIGDWRLVVLDTNFNEDGSDREAKQYVSGFVSESELAWLASVLRTDRPVLVFSHHSPVMSPSSGGTFAVNIQNAASVRAVLEAAGNVVGVVSGHSPYGYAEERNGIHYFVVDTLVNEPALGTFATLDLRYAPGTREAEILFRRVGGNQRSFQMVDRKLGTSENEWDSLPEFFPDEAQLPSVIDGRDVEERY